MKQPMRERGMQMQGTETSHLDALGDVGVGGLEVADAVAVERVEAALQGVEVGRGEAPQVSDGGCGSGGDEGRRIPGPGFRRRRRGREAEAEVGGGGRGRRAARGRRGDAGGEQGDGAGRRHLRLGPGPGLGLRLRLGGGCGVGSSRPRHGRPWLSCDPVSSWAET